MKHVLFILSLIICDQVSASALDDALSAALKESEQDKVSKQVVLEVNPEQIEKATFMKNKEQIVVKVEDSIFDDIASSSAADAIDASEKAKVDTKAEVTPELKAEDNIELELKEPAVSAVSGPVAQISKDLGDI